MIAYYNEFDPKAAAWLRELMNRGLIAPGYIDTRSIEDVRPDELAGYTQCHFFAGIGGWPLALKLAGWSESRPVWTGSCPCQPFSVAGKGKGTKDKRHLWPVFRRLIGECRPPVVFGEQVASKLGRTWLASVRAEMEALGYGVGAADLCAAGVGAPHIRQRLWFVAEGVAHPEDPDGRGFEEIGGPDHPGGLENSEPFRRGGRGHGHATPWGGGVQTEGPSPTGGLADSGSATGERDARSVSRAKKEIDREGFENGGMPLRYKYGSPDGGPATPDPLWRTPDWLYCRDAKWRPVEPGTFPLAHGVPARVGRLRGYGNAIVPQVAAEFIKAYMDVRP